VVALPLPMLPHQQVCLQKLQGTDEPLSAFLGVSFEQQRGLKICQTEHQWSRFSGLPAHGAITKKLRGLQLGHKANPVAITGMLA
jgi:hypothetical protein